MENQWLENAFLPADFKTIEKNTPILSKTLIFLLLWKKPLAYTLLAITD